LFTVDDDGAQVLQCVAGLWVFAPHDYQHASVIQQQGIDYQAVRTIGNDRLCYGYVGDDVTGHMKFMF